MGRELGHSDEIGKGGCDIEVADGSAKTSTGDNAGTCDEEGDLESGGVDGLLGSMESDAVVGGEDNEGFIINSAGDEGVEAGFDDTVDIFDGSEVIGDVLPNAGFIGVTIGDVDGVGIDVGDAPVAGESTGGVPGAVDFWDGGKGKVGRANVGPEEEGAVTGCGDDGVDGVGGGSGC